MSLGLDDVRRSIFAALGLVSACGPLVEPEESGSEGGSGTVATADASASVGDETATPPPAPPVACPSPTVILQSNVEGSLPTGWEVCEGVIHRVSIETCEAPEPTAPACSLAESGCQTDADCTERAHGRCVDVLDLFGEEPFCACSYGCATDSDCDAGEVCACGGEAADYPERSRCIPATCTSDAGCGEGSLCMLGSGDSGCGISNSAACSTPQDTCLTDDQCGDLDDCYPQAEGHWACESFCCCGRPLLVDGRPVTAPAVVRDDWGRAVAAVRVHDLPPQARRRIADHFTQCAQLEHASVASFARFTLELLAIGAPPSLLAAAQQAALDEIDHAQRCFALASTYAGRPIGPGALPVAGTAPATTLDTVLAAVIDEACVGETLAAVEARAAARHAREPAVRAALETIAADELRHAALGWQTLRWALDLADAPTRTRLLARLESSLAAAERDRPPATSDGLQALLRVHGVLDPSDRRTAHDEALVRVLRPCAAALSSHALAAAA